MDDDAAGERAFADRALDALPDLFFVFDAGGTLHRWNARVPEVTGYPDAEIAEMHPTQLFAGEDAERAIRAVQTLIERGRPVTFEADLVTADGETIPYEFRGELLTDREYPDPLIAGIGRDISERRERARQLQVVDRVLRHNLRNDINAIRGSAEGLRGAVPEGGVDAVDRIVTVSDRLLGIARTQREINRLLADPPPLDVVDVLSLVERVVESAREDHPDAEITFDAPESASAIAATAIDAAVAELIDNAVVHADAATPTVEVAVTTGEEAVRIRVADEGPGIPAVERDVLTGERDIDALTHGSGLGLWKVKLLVERSAGRLSFSANEPRGSVVTIELDRDLALA